MSSQRKPNQFPDCLTTKGPIELKVNPIKFGTKTYYQAKTVSDQTDDFETVEKKLEIKPYLDNDADMATCDVEDYEVVLTKSGKFQTTFYVPPSVYPVIIGAKGAKLKALQKSTNTIIRIPRINEKGDINIQGDSERSVIAARVQIDMIVGQRRQRMRPTHFISMPIVSDEIQENLMKFKNLIMKDPPRGVTESCFQKPVKCHQTICVLRCLDEQDVNLAINSFEEFNKSYIDAKFKGTKHRAIVKGVDIMNDDPSSTRVLYANIQMLNPSIQNDIQELFNKLTLHFEQTGLAKKEYDNVKLHMTVMNVTFRDESEGFRPFDATSILERFGDFKFGEFSFDRLDLCIMNTTTDEFGHPKYYDVAFQVVL